MKNKKLVLSSLGFLMFISIFVFAEIFLKNSMQTQNKNIIEGENITIMVKERWYSRVPLDMVWIEPGTFIMGSPSKELGRSSDESQHNVTISKGFWLGKYEVTQAQYKAVMGTNLSYFVCNNNPVEEVNWYNAMEFCEKLTAQEKTAGRLPEGYEYSLPTEAQWEYACRAGTTTALNNGKDLPDKYRCPNMDEVGWYWDNRDRGNLAAHPVGLKQPNAWGLYDMHGNIWEWCLDWYGDYPAESEIDPKGPDTGEFRICRGGCWNYDAFRCRSADRGYCYSQYSYDHIGFRVALVPIQ